MREILDVNLDVRLRKLFLPFEENKNLNGFKKYYYKDNIILAEIYWEKGKKKGTVDIIIQMVKLNQKVIIKMD